MTWTGQISLKGCIYFPSYSVKCLGIRWRHETWISKILKFGFLENKKSFWSEIKNIFPSFTSTLFWTWKTKEWNVVDTTFNLLYNFHNCAPQRMSTNIWKSGRLITFDRNVNNILKIYRYSTLCYLWCLIPLFNRTIYLQK